MSQTPATTYRFAVSTLLLLSAANAAFCSRPAAAPHHAGRPVTGAIRHRPAKASEAQDGIVADALYRQAVGLNQVGDYSRASVLLTKAVEMRPQFGDARAEQRYAATCISAAATEAARLSRAIQAHPAKITSYLKRGEAYYNMGRYDAALSDFGQVIARAPDCANAYRLRSRVYAAKGDETQANADFVAFARKLRGGGDTGAVTSAPEQPAMPLEMI